MARTDGLTPWWHQLKGLNGHSVSCNGVTGTFCYPADATETWKVSIGGQKVSGSDFLRRVDCRSRNPKRSIQFLRSGLSLEESAVYHATEGSTEDVHLVNGGVGEGSAGGNRRH